MAFRMFIVRQLSATRIEPLLSRISKVETPIVINCLLPARTRTTQIQSQYNYSIFSNSIQTHESSINNPSINLSILANRHLSGSTATEQERVESDQFNNNNPPASSSSSSSSRPSGANLANQAKSRLVNLERVFERFEEKCQRAEKVPEKDFIKTFDTMTRTVAQFDQMGQMTKDIKINLALLSAILLRCCGKLMGDSELKTRELLAGNLWHFMKEKKFPLDISHYNSLIRVLNENQTSFDPQKILDEITQEYKLIPDRITYQRLIHQYCLQGDIGKATSLLERMKELEMELNELTFASLIIGYSKQETPPTMTEMFDLMRSHGVEPGNKSYSAAIISLAQLMPKKPSEVEEELKKVFELVQKEEVQFSIYESIDVLTALAPMKDNETVEKIMDFICMKTVNFNFNSRIRLFDTLLKIDKYEQVSKLYWLKEPSENALKNLNIGTFYIKLLSKHKNIPLQHTLNECNRLYDKNYNKKAFYHLFYFSAEEGNLPLVREALKRIGQEEPIKCHYLWPLIAQAKDEKEIVYALKNDFSPKMETNDLLDTFTQWVWPKFADKVERLFELNKEELHYDNNIIMASFLSYFVQEDKIMEAIKFVSEAPQELMAESASPPQSNEGIDSSKETLPDSAEALEFYSGGGRGGGERMSTMGNDRGNLIGRLLRQIAEQTKDPALVMKAYNFCQLPGQQLSSRNTYSLVKVHLLNDDFKSALEVFLKLAREHRIAPCKSDLIIHCLEKKDPESLQKIMDISTELYGETNSLFDLAVCCLKCGKLKQAQKIFGSPGFRANPARVYTISRSFAKQGNVNVLENFVHLTRDMFDVNQETLYQILIDAYERSSNGKRVLDLWNRMQEEEFQPSKRSLLMIADVLERNNIAVPFQRPKLDSWELNRNR